MNTTITSQFSLVKPKYDIGRLFAEWIRNTKAIFDWAGSQILDSRPFSYFIYTENGITVAKENKMIRDTEWTLKHGKKYTSAEEAHRDVLGDDYYKDGKAL